MRHEFVEHMPDQLEANVLYVSIQYDLAMHRCFCGCGQEVVTPLSPAEWSLGYNGRSVSLYPSIGNWSFPCKSHYWIKDGKVVWASRFSDEKIAMVREKDRQDLGREYDEPKPDRATKPESDPTPQPAAKKSWLARLAERFF
jgi:hypothetical protein